MSISVEYHAMEKLNPKDNERLYGMIEDKKFQGIKDEILWTKGIYDDSLVNGIINRPALFLLRYFLLNERLPTLKKNYEI